MQQCISGPGGEADRPRRAHRGRRCNPCSGLCLFSSFRRAPASTRNNDAHFDLKSPWQTRLQQFSPRWLLASAAPYAPTWHDLTPTAVMLKASAIRPMAASASGLSQARRNEFRGSTSGWCLVMRRRRQVVCRFQIRDSGRPAMTSITPGEPETHRSDRTAVGPHVGGLRWGMASACCRAPDR